MFAGRLGVGGGAGGGGGVGWGWGGGGATFVLVPLEIQKAVCLALGTSTGGRYDVELAKLG